MTLTRVCVAPRAPVTSNKFTGSTSDADRIVNSLLSVWSVFSTFSVVSILYFQCGQYNTKVGPAATSTRMEALQSIARDWFQSIFAVIH